MFPVLWEEKYNNKNKSEAAVKVKFRDFKKCWYKTKE